VQLEKTNSNSLLNNLCENYVLLCPQISISFGHCHHILNQNHNALASIVCLKKLFIVYFEIVVKNKNVLFKFTFSIYNQQLSFTLAIPSSPYTNNDDNNGNIILTFKKTFEFSNGIHVKKHGNQFGFKNSD